MFLSSSVLLSVKWVSPIWCTELLFAFKKSRVISCQKKFYSNLTNYFASLPKNHLNSFHFVLNLKLLKLGHFDLVLNFVEMMDGYISYVSTHSVLFLYFSWLFANRLYTHGQPVWFVQTICKYYHEKLIFSMFCNMGVMGLWSYGIYLPWNFTLIIPCLYK